MKISNIIKLVKAGYTPAEIADLERSDEVLQLIEEGINKEDVPALLELAVDVPEKPPAEPEKVGSLTAEPEYAADPIDYKMKYETLLKETQTRNARGNIADDLPDNKKTIEEMVKSFM